MIDLSQIKSLLLPQAELAALLQAGQPCPDCQKGKLRTQREPAAAVQITAQPPVAAVIHELERLRCDGCGKVFTAATPPDVKPEKYDAKIGRAHV